jgi:hypothetical protein
MSIPGVVTAVGAWMAEDTSFRGKRTAFVRQDDEDREIVSSEEEGVDFNTRLNYPATRDCGRHHD